MTGSHLRYVNDLFSCEECCGHASCNSQAEPLRYQSLTLVYGNQCQWGND